METVKMRKIGTIKSYSHFISFLKGLQNEFYLTKFPAILALVDDPSYFRYRVDLTITSEDSYGAVSEICLGIWGSADGEDGGYEIELRWTTSSDHVVKMVGMYDYENTNVDVFIGEDESSYFYPTIQRILERAEGGA